MYISIRDGIVTHAGFPTVAEGLKALAVDAVEVGVDRDLSATALEPEGGRDSLSLAADADVKQFAEHFASRSVRVSGFLLANDFNREDLDAELDWVTRVVQVADQLSIPAVRVDAVMHGERDLPLEARVQRFVDCTREVLRRTEGSPVDLGIENHGYQGNDPEFLRGIFNAVGSDRLGMTLDTGNFYWSGKPLSRVYEIIEELAPLAKHTHCKNINFPEELREQQRDLGWGYSEYVSPLPDGDIDHARVFAVLRDAGYDRDVCIEDESLGKFSPDERGDVLRRDVEHFGEILAKLG